MIRVELLGRQRQWSPWSKVFLAALVVCGGLYGIYQIFPALQGSLFNAGSAPSPVAQQAITPSSVVQQEITPKPTEQQEAAPSPTVQQKDTLDTPSPTVQREITPSPTVRQKDIPEITPSPVVQQEITTKPAVQQKTTPKSIVQREAASRPATPAPTTSQAPSLRRSTACHQAMRIDEQVPAGVRVASLNCDSTGEYWLEGTSPSHKVLREFRLRLQALPSRVSFSTWREERTLRFAFQGRFAERDTPPLAALFVWPSGAILR